MQTLTLQTPNALPSLPVRGAWVEMFVSSRARDIVYCRSPCGERGLKFCCEVCVNPHYQSLPVRGAWVEMMLHGQRNPRRARSLPVRGAWVEMRRAEQIRKGAGVAPRAGSVG